MKYPTKREEYQPRMDREGLRLAASMRDIRQRRGLTQGEMCFYYKISRETYWRWERFAPPMNPPVRMWIRHVIKVMQKRAHDAKRGATRDHPRTRPKFKAGTDRGQPGTAG